jgi:hypothetical protein
MLHGGPENHPPYSAKSIYAYFYTHNTPQSNLRQPIAGIYFDRFLSFINAKTKSQPTIGSPIITPERSDMCI